MQPHELAEGSATPKRRSSTPSRTATAFRGRTLPGSGATRQHYYHLKANSKIKTEVGTQTFTVLAEELGDRPRRAVAQAGITQVRTSAERCGISDLASGQDYAFLRGCRPLKGCALFPQRRWRPSHLGDIPHKSVRASRASALLRLAASLVSRGDGA